MCGICGYLNRREAATAAPVIDMARTLAHRGPDAERWHVDGPIALGHRRLSVIDLTTAAHEPLTNEDETLWLVFNGEIYNFRELRRTLEPRHRFSSRGDAETILHLYEERGDELVQALDGMFAFALWDTRRRRLLLARDRTGKKPLFYYDGPSLFAFASEVKALLAHPGVPHDRDEAAIPLYLTYGYVPTPGTFYRGLRAVQPGHTLVATDAGTEGPTAYWSVQFRDGRVDGEHEAEERLRDSLRQAVAKRLVADVPLGAFLSGGLDSSAVVAFMAETAAGRVKTFTIGFAGRQEYDERQHARTVAERFGTDHTEFVVEPTALDLIDRLVWHHDGPFGDSSAIPTFLLSQLTRSCVTVALDGNGGDEVFGGYLRMYGGALAERLPHWLLRTAEAGLALLPEPADRRHPIRYAKRFTEAARMPLLERYLRWNGFFTDGLLDLLQPELSALGRPDRVLASYRDALRRSADPVGESRISALSSLVQLNFETYLPDDLHVKLDRMSMAHALEVRSPFLDTAVIEFGASLPDRMRMRWGQGKVLLRRAMKGILPESILKRGKMGFGVPLGAWFRDELEGLVRERLLDAGSPIYEYLRPEPVAQLVVAHQRAAADCSPQIWLLLTLESWLRQEKRWPVAKG
jgi:asparagine synthase (glutamine-hydrolysing)